MNKQGAMPIKTLLIIGIIIVAVLGIQYGWFSTSSVAWHSEYTNVDLLSENGDYAEFVIETSSTTRPMSQNTLVIDGDVDSSFDDKNPIISEKLIQNKNFPAEVTWNNPKFTEHSIGTITPIIVNTTGSCKVFNENPTTNGFRYHYHCEFYGIIPENSIPAGVGASYTINFDTPPKLTTKIYKIGKEPIIPDDDEIPQEDDETPQNINFFDKIINFVSNLFDRILNWF